MRCVLGKGMNTGLVCHHNHGWVNIPVTLVLSDMFCQHVMYLIVHMVNHAIILWVVRCSSFLDILDVQHHFIASRHNHSLS